MRHSQPAQGSGQRSVGAAMQRRSPHQFNATQAQLGADRLAVGLDRIDRQTERLGHLLVVHSLTQALKHPEFAW